MLRRSSVTYNEFGLGIYSESVNCQRRDTSKIRTFYDEQKRVSKYIQNGPYFPDRYDTTYYVYSGDTTIIIQGDQYNERITKKDNRDRRFYFSGKTFDEKGTLIRHTLDSIIYDDIANTATTRAYKMDNYSFPKPRKQQQRIHIDGNRVDVVTDAPRPMIITTNNKEPELELVGTGFAQYNNFDKVTHMINSFSGNGVEVFMEYDSLGRQIRHEIFKKTEDYHKITTYEYEQKGDTLITYQRNSETPDVYVSKGSVEQVDGQPLWQMNFFNGNPSSKYFVTYDEHGNRIETSHWRAKKDTDELIWNIERTVYKYELLPITE